MTKIVNIKNDPNFQPVECISYSRAYDRPESPWLNFSGRCPGVHMESASEIEVAIRYSSFHDIRCIRPVCNNVRLWT